MSDKRYTAEEVGDNAYSFIDQGNIDCADCLYSTNLSGVCYMFPSKKPLFVLKGDLCEKKKKIKK